MDLNIQGVSKTFGETTALHQTDLIVRHRRFTTLLGPSGCGKTTLLRMIAGLERPDTGRISLGDQTLFSAAERKDVPVHKRQFGMVFQDFALWPHMTVYDNVAYGLMAGKRHKDVRSTVMEALASVRLRGMEQRYPHELSGGQQQRVAFARAVAIRPRLVLFDEPLSALDAVLREEMRVEMMSLVHDLGLTALYVTHDQMEAMSMSNEIVVMNSGQILQSGAPEDIYNRPSNALVARFIGKSNWLIEDEIMFRPEHILWESDHQSSAKQLERYRVNIRHVSYLGDRYEIGLTTDTGQHWMAYHHTRLSVGEQRDVFVSKEHIHYMKQS
ncbi:Spermidine/putrescine import ATP-binding protein PotA [compost metagenome]